MTANWLDAAILFTFFWFGLTGLIAGLVRGGLTALAFIIGVILAGIFYQRLAGDLRSFISNETAVRVVAILAIFGATALAGQLLAIVLKQVFAVLFFGPLDGIGGFLLGLVKAFVVIELVLLVFVVYRDRVPFFGNALSHSLLAGYLLRDFPLLTHILPDEFSRAVVDFTKQTQ